VNAPIKVLLVDDEGLVRSGFKVLLDLEDDITVVGEATAGAEAVERVRATRPDVVLMDIRMPTLDGIQATTQIAGTRGLEQVRVLILSPPTTPTTTSSRHYRPAPAASLLKDAGPAELLHAIRVIAAGDSLLAPRITRRLISQFTAHRTATQAAENRLAVLTERERQVLTLVGNGRSNDEIGAELFLSPATARNPRQPRHGETRRPRPRPTGRHRLPNRTGQPKHVTSISFAGIGALPAHAHPATVSD
jgi:DNA-binding NarL/FixJ family response regulator